MKRIIFATILLPMFLNASLDSLKKEIELKKKINLVEIENTHLMNKFFYLSGKAQGYFEILEIIEMMEQENASKKERS